MTYTFIAIIIMTFINVIILFINWKKSSHMNYMYRHTCRHGNSIIKDQKKVLSESIDALENFNRETTLIYNEFIKAIENGQQHCQQTETEK